MASAQEEAAAHGIQEGSRWIGGRPKGDEFANWFITTVRMHEGMDPKLYAPGITLIPANEKIKKKVTLQNGREGEKEEWRQVFTPYAKVDTRIAYFWDLCELRGWLGEIEYLVPPNAVTTYMEQPLPDHVYLMPYPRDDGKVGFRLACTARIRVFDPEQRNSGSGYREVMKPPAATKVGAVSSDVNSLLRVETGAIGRALGMAGMLVIPGSGVATAEDMQELGTVTTTPEDAQLPEGGPEAAPEAPSLRERFDELRAQLEDKPALADELDAWAQERKPPIDLNNVKEEQLRGLVRQAEKVLARAEK